MSSALSRYSGNTPALAVSVERASLLDAQLQQATRDTISTLSQIKVLAGVVRAAQQLLASVSTEPSAAASSDDNLCKGLMLPAAVNSTSIDSMSTATAETSVDAVVACVEGVILPGLHLSKAGQLLAFTQVGHRAAAGQCFVEFTCFPMSCIARMNAAEMQALCANDLQGC